MRDLIRMWSNTRMIVLVAISAAVYAAILLPFKLFPIVPGVTELRPATAIPPLASLLFGPAAAWGMGFGNLIGDFASGLGPVTPFGMLGNFLLGWMPYRLWRAMSSEPLPRFISGEKASASSQGLLVQVAEFLFIIVVASAACALVIGWGGLIFEAFPVKAVVPIIFVNNVLWGGFVTPLVARAVAPRVRAWGLTADQILGVSQRSQSPTRLIGLFLAPASALGGVLVLYLLAGSPGEAAGVDLRWLAGVPSVLVLVGTALL
ncbi:MAG: QueT transporter family protein [Deltaproteobacteria bacterium]|nr:QueT transporter family protein [Deltaproteobacteria bacterium]